MALRNSVLFPQLLDASILRDLSRETQEFFLDSCKRRTFKAGETMLRQGEQTDSMLIVAEGRIEVSYVNETGHHSIIYHAFSGNVLGMVETLSERPCAGTCKALSDTTVLMCRRSDLIKKMASKVFVRNFAADLHDVLAHDNRFKSIDQFFSAEQKICVYLEKLSQDGSVFTESQGYLADVVGCSRQTVNKELGRLRDRGIIEMTKAGIRILDIKALSNRLTELGDTKATGTG
ncbi:Crp/Fnr family transcriptional regulator [Litoreibacter halocynthiae]|uniref:Crp/Fnr family transcriptional regulator n=1 Tax=Litoreibacter halocynthiae TaxID=1242689 RepID=A0A4V3EWW9_9RHOB|nr:Crp/Fnr family transcriptional regulator [Litoreibacter halocynthiae]